MLRFNKFVFMTVCLLVVVNLAKAAKLSGYVRDIDTNEPLIGATVYIEGTTNGTITNYDGYYSLVVSAGTQKVIASYLGYNEIIHEITIQEGVDTKQDFLLSLTKMEIDELTVTLQVKGQKKALNQQLNSNYISNVISSERLQELPDATVASSLSRIPGISVTSSAGEGDKIRIRGMEPKLNLVTVNGVRAPSGDANESSVGLAGISPFMIDGIEVQKSLTPDKDGDVVGGIVDLKLKDADEGFKVNMILQNNSNNQIESYFNPRITLQLGNRFFKNKLGILVVGNYEDIDRSNESMSAWGNVYEKSDGTPWQKLEGANFRSSEYSRKRYGGSAFLDYRLEKGSIKANSFINGLSNDELNRTFNWSSEGNRQKVVNCVESNSLSMIHTLQFQHKLFLNSTFDASLSYSSAKSKMPVNYSTNARTSGLDYSEHPELLRFKENSTTIYPYELQEELNFIPDSAFWIESMNSSDNTFNEDESTAAFNWLFPFVANDKFSGSFKFGGKYRQKNREYDANDRGAGFTVGGQDQLKAFILENNPGFDFGLGKFNNLMPSNAFATYYLQDDYNKVILDDQFNLSGFMDRAIMEQIIRDLDEDGWSAVPTAKDERRDVPNDYKGNETITAVYGMGDFNITNYFQIIGGARYEKMKTDYRSVGVNEAGTEFATIEQFGDSMAVKESSFLLPMVNFRIKPNSWLQFRLAYTQSIARPSYYNYMPRYRLGRLKDIDNIGNPDLKTAKVHNIDAYVSVKVNNPNLYTSGVLTAGVFSKKIEGYEYTKTYAIVADSSNKVHPYYPNIIASNGNIRVPINNPYPAYSKGIELDWQGSLQYLPSPFNGIVFGVNYTYTYTEQTQEIQLVDKVTPDPKKPWIIKTSVRDSAYAEEMFSQPKHMFNASVGYDYKGFSARLAYNRIGEALTGYNGSLRKYEENKRLNAVQQFWDLSISQNIPKVKGLQVFCNVTNISSTYNKKDFINLSGGGEPYPLFEEYYGRLLILGLRFKM